MPPPAGGATAPVTSTARGLHALRLYRWEPAAIAACGLVTVALSLADPTTVPLSVQATLLTPFLMTMLTLSVLAQRELMVQGLRPLQHRRKDENAETAILRLGKQQRHATRVAAEWVLATCITATIPLDWPVFWVAAGSMATIHGIALMVGRAQVSR